MEKPVIKDKSALAYVEYLENLIEEFKNHTKKKYYRGIQRQLDLLAEEMLDPSFQVSMKTTYEWEGDKRVKVDTGFDAFFEMIVKGEAIIKNMDKFEEAVFPKAEDSQKKLLEDAGSAEHLALKHLKNGNGG